MFCVHSWPGSVAQWIARRTSSWYKQRYSEAVGSSPTGVGGDFFGKCNLSMSHGKCKADAARAAVHLHSTVDTHVSCANNVTKLGVSRQRWFSGRILACHAGGPGSIPGRCKFFALAFDAHQLCSECMDACMSLVAARWSRGMILA